MNAECILKCAQANVSGYELEIYAYLSNYLFKADLTCYIARHQVQFFLSARILCHEPLQMFVMEKNSEKLFVLVNLPSGLNSESS